MNLTDSWYDCFDSGPTYREAPTGPRSTAQAQKRADIYEIKIKDPSVQEVKDLSNI